MYDFSLGSSNSKVLPKTDAVLGINKTIHLNHFSNGSVSLEGETDCNLDNKTDCYK
ncbi:unnamed protein product, partial [Adineta steineri]